MEKSDIIIDPEFAHKIPPLTDDEFNRLEENIIADGEVYEPIVTWNGVIVDGHNRWKIIQKHPQIPYSVKEMDFPDKWSAFAWMYSKQLGRRNLTQEQKAYLIGKRNEAEKLAVGANQHSKNEGVQNGPARSKGKTAQKIADEYGIGYGTVIRNEKFAKGIDKISEVNPEVATEILSGRTSVPMSAVQELPNAEPETVIAAVEKIKAGERLEPETIKSLRDYKEPLVPRVSTLEDHAPNLGEELADVLEDLNLTADTFLRQFEKTLRENRKLVKGNLAEVVSVMERVKKSLEKMERRF